MVANLQLLFSAPCRQDRPDRILIITHEFSGLGPYVNTPVHVIFSANRWQIFAGGSTNLPMNAKFNVLAAAPGDNAFAHVASTANTSTNQTIIDSPVLKDKLNARVFVTAARPGTNNPHPIGVFYSGNRWRIFNQDLAVIPAGAR